ncbi:MAG: 30S ribosomal protein S17 [Planctomycetaceae bacterium]|nr:30S ribosomal protein S17 [Planctomycetaceae bacterium]
MRKRAVGLVVRDKMQKTRRVEVPRLYRHPKYGKTMKTKTICYVHDENNESHNGDLVEIVESRPLSKLKRWALIRVVTKSTSVEIKTVDAAAK